MLDGSRYGTQLVRTDCQIDSQLVSHHIVRPRLQEFVQSHRFSKPEGVSVQRNCITRVPAATLLQGCFKGGLPASTNFLLSAVLDRRAQLRTLHGVGVTASQVGGALVAEGGILGLVGAAMGLAAGAVAARIIVLHSVPMVDGWHFAFEFPLLNSLGLCAGIAALAAVGGLLPAWIATRRGRHTEAGE